MTEIALFPIPKCVVFPGTVTPLHVFEPRYRTMIHHCIDNTLPLAVCHVKNFLHLEKESQAFDGALTSNQATYNPVDVCSAGRCELIETLKDGRLLINVHADKRYRLIKETQSLPFLIFNCAEFPDKELSPSESNLILELKDKLLHRLIALTNNNKQIQSVLDSQEWQSKNADDFSFELFSVLQTDADKMQEILEMDFPADRLNAALDILSQIPAQL